MNIIRHNRYPHHKGWLSGLMLSLMLGFSVNISHAALSQTPLFLTVGTKPNIMLMLDNSGSMSNIVPETPYDPDTTYIASCPAARLIPAGTSVDIVIESSQPKISYSSTNYVLGTGTGEKCFETTSTYGARLNLNGSSGNTTVQGGYLDADYTGNYLNWYFNAGNTTPTWTTQQRKPGTQSRIEIARTSAKGLVDSLSNARLGLSTYNGGDGGSLREIIGDVDDAKKTGVKTKIDALTATGNTPLAETLSDIGRYFATGYTGNLTLRPGQSNESTATVTDVFNSHSFSNDSGQTIVNPIQNSCQKSFAVMMTDGRPQGDRAISASLRDYTGDCAASPSQCDATSNSTNLPNLPITNTGSTTTCDSSNRNFLACENGTKAGRTYESQGSDYLDDVAKGLFEMDLRPDLVDSNGAKNNLITYTIGFADTSVANDPLLSDAATRGGGLFLTATNSSQLTAAFQGALTDITSKSASASAVAANSTQLNTGTQVYQAKFDSTDWSGQLQAYNVNVSTGELTPNWEASLPAHASRKIYTYKPSAAAGSRGVLFEWDNLTKDSDTPAPLPFSQQTYLNTLNGVVDTTKGTLRLDWLRGDRTNEKISDADTISNPAHIFRKRSKVLGDIVNSDPIFVGQEDYGYDTLPSIGSNYASFVTSKASRTPMLYMGANDGMLHGFDANKTGGGAEIFAYIPNALLPELSKLTSPTYAHQYYVDGLSAAGDVYDSVNANWHTMLAGTTGAGGRAVFALDVTNPSAFGASSALWEFTSANDADLGYTLAQPAVVRMQDGSWAVIVANGYSSDNGHAVLFILDALTGAVLQKIDTGAGNTTNKNGLSSPIAVDTDNDRSVDTVYAGDLYGNLWKFDVSGTAGSWPTPASPLFVACTTAGASCDPANRQPITGKPNVGQVGGAGTSQNGIGIMVYFGTGKYFETGDNIVGASPQVQTFYGLWDKGSPITDRASLQEQTIDFEGVATTVGGTSTTRPIRVVSKNPVCYATGPSCTSLKSGWALNLLKPVNIAQGERAISFPLVRRGLVIFATAIPSPDPCEYGGTSWLMEVDALAGGEFGGAPFDINGDGKVDNKDKVVIVVDGVSVEHYAAGDNLGVGIHKQPAKIESESGVDYGYVSGSKDAMAKSVEAGGTPPPGGGSTGTRRSWWQLK